MFRLFECCALSFFERFVLSLFLKIERFVSDSAEIWICGLYMIQTYHLLDGGQITAASPEEFVRLLREGSRFDYDCTDQEYMENFARRYGELHGVSVATDTPEHFLTDLQAAGYVR